MAKSNKYSGFELSYKNILQEVELLMGVDGFLNNLFSSLNVIKKHFYNLLLV